MTPRSAIKAEQAAKRSDDFINKDYGVGLSLDQLKADVSGVRSALTDEVSLNRTLAGGRRMALYLDRATQALMESTASVNEFWGIAGR